MHQLITHSVSGQNDSFRDGVRARDRKCVISGVINMGSLLDIWSGFNSAHIFLLQNESYWNEANFNQCITDMDNMPGSSRLNSCQNGFLLQSSIHDDFVNYLVSVNPDVSELYQIHCL